MNLAEMMRIILDVREEAMKGNEWTIGTKFLKIREELLVLRHF